MFQIDNRTLALMVFFIAMLMTGALVFFTLGMRRYPGQWFWVAGSGMEVLGFFLILLQGRGEVFFSIFLSNMTLIAAFVLILIGIHQFVAIRIKRWQITGYLVFGTFFFIYFSYVDFNTKARIVGISFFATLVTLQCGRTLLNGRALATGVQKAGAIVFFCCSFLYAARIVVVMTTQPMRGGTILSQDPVTGLIFLVTALMIISWAIVIIAMISGRIDHERQTLIKELRQSIAEIKTLEGLIPICANCHNVRDDQGFWQKVERYVSARTSAQFSHGICPDCLRKLYPEVADEILEKAKII